MSKLILKSDFSLGDTVLLTAAVRDLHRCCPGQYRTDVRTGFPDLWRHNPLLTPLNPYDRDVETVSCELPLVQRSNEAACHVLHGFMDFLSRFLGVRIQPTEFRGDLHLSRAERAGASPLRRLAGAEAPYWLISTGGRWDNTIKWWEARRYQEVVDHFAGRIQFVQVGHASAYHPRLEGVIDLRGRTSVRELVRWMHRAEGVVCGVTSLMHLAAATPRPAGSTGSRPCVVVAGGREPPSWEAYPGHQFIHTIGMLPCCATGGCWKWRTQPLGDGGPGDRPDNLCVDRRGDLPHCMDLISSQEVIRRIDLYLQSGAARPLDAAQARRTRRVAASRPEPRAYPYLPLNILTALPAAEERIATLPSYPGGFHGRGVVICAGGAQFFTNAWVCLHMLRRAGCHLPAQLWSLGPEEMDPEMRRLVAPLGAECVDASAVRRRRPLRQLHGWLLKPYAILHSPFREVLLLDADNVPVANPEPLFEAPPYRRTGAVFWPDYLRLAPDRSAWRVFGVRYRDEPEFETGQALIDKAVCWKALHLALWYNEHSDFFYQYGHGDKETFHMAFRKLGRPYAMPSTPIHPLPGVMCQHDFKGRRLFQHRNLDKWTLDGRNRRIPGFLYEEECRGCLSRLRELWDGRAAKFRREAARRRNGAHAPAFLPGGLRLAAFMVSCPQRARARAETLRRLQATDWGEAPVGIVIDEGRFRCLKESHSHTAWRALRAALRTRADYLLCLEDDLAFNRFLRHNLQSWRPLIEGQAAFATLCNLQPDALAWDLARAATVVNAPRYFGSQAVLLSRALARYFLEHWFDAPPELDMKWKVLCQRAGERLLAHAPSLVGHRGRRSALGNRFLDAIDFSPDWRAPAENGASRIRFLPVPRAASA